VNVLLRRPWFGFHTVTAVLGYTGFAVSAVYSTLFLLLYGDLKRRRFGFFFDRLPSLEILSKAAIHAATLGLVFLSAAIVGGAVGWVREMNAPVLLEPKVVSTLLVWLVYAIGVGLYHFTGWRGIRCIGITLVAFLLMLASTLLVPAFLESAHDVRRLLEGRELL
jgi:ABC-type uncharacterized transport system permease subunit